MLDQRGAEERGFISLKEAAKIADYTPDYVGQLIRAGKIKGEQVYSTVAWVTTEDEVLAYMQDKSRTVQNSNSGAINTIKEMSSYFLYGLIGLCAVTLLFLQYVLYVSIDAGIEKSFLSKSTEQTTQETITLSSM